MLSPAPRPGGLLGNLDSFPEHLRLIGSIVTHFAVLEVGLSLLMWELLGDVYRGDAVFYAIRGNRERVNMLQALAHGLPDGATKTNTRGARGST